MIDSEEKNEFSGQEESERWQAPAIVERGKIEARLFSDEPDPWGP